MVSAGANLPIRQRLATALGPQSQGSPKMLFIYEICIKRGQVERLLVYPSCSKLKYNAAEVDCSASARSHFPSTHTSLSLSLFLARSLARAHTRACGREKQHFQLNRYVASLILHASIAEITAQLLPLSYV